MLISVADNILLATCVLHIFELFSFNFPCLTFLSSFSLFLLVSNDCLRLNAARHICKRLCISFENYISICTDPQSFRAVCSP